jgi:hypothetical protein
MKHTSSILRALFQKRQVISVLSVVMIVLTLGVSVAFTHLHSAHAANALSWSSGNMIGQKSIRPPAMAAFNNKLYVAYVALDSIDIPRLWVTTSSDGTNWSPGTFTWSPDTSTNLYMKTSPIISPALAVYNNKLYVAYVADYSYQLMIASSSDGINWFDVAPIPNQYTLQTPALAVYNNKLYVAFTASDESGHVLIASYDGTNWSGDSQVSNPSVTQYSNTAPSLAAYNNQLYVAFVAHNGSKDVLIASYDGTSWSNDTKINQSSQAAPTLTVYNNELSVAFTDNSKNDHLLYVSSDGTNWPNNIWVPNQYTHQTPAAAVLNNTLYVVFLANNKSGDLFVVSGSGASSPS